MIFAFVCFVVPIYYPHAFILKQSLILTGTRELKKRHVTTLRPRGLCKKAGSSSKKLRSKGKKGAEKPRAAVCSGVDARGEQHAWD